VRVWRAQRVETPREGRQGVTVEVMVETRQKDHVRRDLRDDLHGREDVGVPPVDVAQEKPRPIARQADIPGREADRIGLERRGRERQDQTSCKSTS
jgi:hypothetical protein